MRELREWIRAAEAARTTCLNVPEFDVLIRHQKQRLQEFERISFGLEHLDGRPISVTDLPARPEVARKRRRTAEEAEIVTAHVGQAIFHGRS
jgi:hypothetical protein